MKKKTDEMSAMGRLVRCAEREAPLLSDEAWTLAMKQIAKLREPVDSLNLSSPPAIVSSSSTA